MRCLLGFLAGLVGEWVAETWTVRYTNAVNGKYAGISRADMEAKVWRARKAGLILLGLSQIDNSAIFGGPGVFACVVAGAAVGAWGGLGSVMWAKWNTKNPDEDEDEDE